MKYPIPNTLYALCYPLYAIISTNSYVRIYKLFMQNKPNFQKAQMNVNPYNTTDYENKLQRRVRKNKPNSNPNKPNLRKAKMNLNSIIAKDYRKKDDFTVRINKPNSNPISERPKMNINIYIIEDYENERLCRPKKTNPNKANFTYPQNPPSYHKITPFLLPLCQRIILKNLRVLAIGFSGFIHINSALCLFYHFDRLGYLFQLWYLE